LHQNIIPHSIAPLNTKYLTKKNKYPIIPLCIEDKYHDPEHYTEMICQKGDMLVHHCNKVHFSLPNTSTTRTRRALMVVFFREECENDPYISKMFMEKTSEYGKLIQ
jgi:ectoine hydroxylase-related dioxygenase (phytanoyl-CoA dioxygenase family)